MLSKLFFTSGIIRKSLLCAAALLMLSMQISYAADNSAYGPRFEGGITGSGSRMRSRPDWSSKLFVKGGGYLSYRILYGLSIQGGKNFGIGNLPLSAWITTSQYDRIDPDKGGYSEGSWAGIRYDVPLSLLNQKIYDIHTIYIAGGTAWDTYGVRSSITRHYSQPYGWISGSTWEDMKTSRSFKVADLTGYYVALAARWRFNTLFTESKDSWIGSYGLDIGVRYTRYTDCDCARDDIEEARSNFNYYQIFVSGFLKYNILF